MKSSHSNEIRNKPNQNRRKNDSKVSVLVVDDDLSHQLSLRNLIETIGLGTKGANDGYEAIKLLNENEFEIILLDINMPLLDGHEVLDHINQNTHFSAGIIVITGDPSQNVEQQTLRNGADDFIRKPYSPDEVLASIQNLLKKNQLEQEKNQIQKQLDKTEMLYRFIVNSSPDLIFFINTKGNFTFINKTITKLIGYERNELLDQHYESLFIDTNEQIKDFLNSKKPNLRSSEFEVIAKPRDKNHKSLIMELKLMQVSSKNSRSNYIYGVARNVTERKKAQELISFQAYHDMLTRLPNRILFKERLGVAMNQAKLCHEKIAVMFLDLDRFKTVNDSLGHSIGDQLLIEVSQRLTKTVREGDTVARLGGDEFTLILPSLSENKEAVHVANKVMKELNKVISVEQHEFHISASIGIAVFPDHGTDIETLLKNADMAMYEVKAGGRNGFGFYTQHMEVKYTKRLSLENSIRYALENDEFEIHYQPQINMHNQQFYGMEALIRWRRTDDNYTSPTEFISYAEECGLIIPIGNWVLETVISDLCYWDHLGFKINNASLNVSYVQLEQANFIPFIEHLLEKYQFSGNRLVFEITENVLIDDIELVLKQLNKINALGISISIDDFGTGYSSLSYLRNLPISGLKIDRTFVNGINSEMEENSIIKAIVSMANSLNMSLVAEGIEDWNQAKYLQSINCLVAQGYLFFKPLSTQDFTNFLYNNN